MKSIEIHPTQPLIGLQLPRDDVYQLACSYLRGGRLDSADPLFQALLQQNTEDPDVLGMLGALRLSQGHVDAAVQMCQRAHQLDPSTPLHIINLASALFALEQSDDAIALLQKACIEHPDHVMAHYNLGNFLRDTKRPQEACVSYMNALQIDPQHLNAMNNLGTVLIDLGRYTEADAMFRRVLEIDAANASASGNLALLAATQGQDQNAVDLYNQVPPSNDPRLNAGVRFNQSLSLIRIGNYELGFPLYEWRWRGSPTLYHLYRFTPEQQWRGEPLQGKRLLVWGEQGFGDTLQFVRYLGLVAERQPARLTLLTHPALLRLFKLSLPPTVEVLERSTMPSPELGPEWDFHCPIMSLALAIAHPEPVRKSQVPRESPYLRADEAEVLRWEKKLSGIEPERPLRVGLSWRTGQKDNGGRSFGLDEAMPLMNLPGVRFYRLTRTEPTRPTEETPEGLNLIDLSADLHDFAATAAFMKCLDLVLSVDTSVLHLAGALGVPTLGVYPTYGGNFFDVGEGEQTWYPKVTVWRQTTMGDWQGLLTRVAQHLMQMRQRAEVVEAV